LVSTVGLSFGLCGTACAQLTLHLDTTAKELWFTGTDTGTAVKWGIETFYTISWAAGTGSAGSVGASSITATEISLAGNTYYGSLPSQVYTYSAPSSVVSVRLWLNHSSETTLAGTGSKISYATWGAENRANLESYIGSVLPLQYGSELGDLAVVPEPGPYALIAGLGLVGFAGWRRWRNHA